MAKASNRGKRSERKTKGNNLQVRERFGVDKLTPKAWGSLKERTSLGTCCRKVGGNTFYI